jgi:hypothetical protein
MAIMQKTINNKSNDQKSTIVYDMRADDSIRAVARRGHEVAKTLRSIGICFKRIIPASTDISVKKQFKLAQNSDLICIELNYNLVATDQLLMINDVRDQIMKIGNYTIIDEGAYKYDSTSQVYRLLLKINSGSSK